MATTTDYLNQLQTDKQTLVDNLNEKGVEASNSETFTELVPKVLDIQSGGDGSEYFTETISNGISSSSGLARCIKKMPPLSFNGTNASYMFYNCSGLTTIDVSNFDTSNVTDMSYMFNGCRGLTELNLSNFDMSSVDYQVESGGPKGLNFMFSGCTNLITLDMGGIDISTMNGDLNNAFNRCSNLTNFIPMTNIGKGSIFEEDDWIEAEGFNFTLSQCPLLTHESLLSIINNLYDFSTFTGEIWGDYKLVIGTANKAKLTNDEIAIATSKGWTVS